MVRSGNHIIEALEARRLLTTFTVNGTIGPDTITLGISDGFIVAIINGTTQFQLDSLIDDVVINANAGEDTIDINSNGLNPVTVNGGSGDDLIRITPAAMDMDGIGSRVQVTGGTGLDDLVMFDQLDPGNRIYNFRNNTGAGELLRSTISRVTWGVDSVELTGSSSLNTFIFSGPPAAPTTVNDGRIELNAGAGQDVIFQPGTAQRSGSILIDGRSIVYNEVFGITEQGASNVTFITPNASDQIQLGGQSGSASVSGSSGGVLMSSVSISGHTSLTVDLATNDAGGGDDAVTIGNADNPSSGGTLLSLAMGTGDNRLVADGGGATLNASIGPAGSSTLDVVIDRQGSLRFRNPQSIRRIDLGPGGLLFNGTGDVLVAQELHVHDGIIVPQLGLSAAQHASITNAFSIDADAHFIANGDGILDIGGAQSHGINSVFDAPQGTVNFFSDVGSATSRTLTLRSVGTTNFHASQHLRSLTVTLGATSLIAGGGRVIVTDHLLVNNIGSFTGSLNLNDNDLIVDYASGTPSPLAATHNFLASGFANGAWNGPGINSSAAAASAVRALGYAEATDLFSTFPASFEGEQVDDSAILIKHTFYGDTNLDGQTNLADFNRLATNFGQSERRWIAGDSDYNLTVNLADFNRLAGAFGRTGAGSQSNGLSDDPEDELALFPREPGVANDLS